MNEELNKEISNYISNYQKFCKDKNIEIRKELVSYITNQRNTGIVPSEILLKGNSNELRNKRINDNHIFGILNPLKYTSFLRILDLRYNIISDIGAETIARFLLDNRSVESLILKSNEIGPHGAACISKALHINEYLKHLDISCNPICQEGGMAVASMLQINTTLKKLEIYSCSLNSVAIIALATVLRNNSTLNYIDFSDNFQNTHNLTQSVQNAVMLHISNMIKYNNNLCDLRMKKMCITDWAMVDFLEKTIKMNTTLKILDLSSNKLTRDGCVALCSALHYHHSLKSLRLSHCTVQDEGANAIKELLLINEVIEGIFLDFNKITHVGIKYIVDALKVNKSLKIILLWGNIWDTEACNTFVNLLGGPVVSLKCEPNADRTLPKHYSKSGPVRKYTDCPEIHNIDGESHYLTHNCYIPCELADKVYPKSRIHPNNTDVVFYEVEGVLNIARNPFELEKEPDEFINIFTDTE
ncbi:RNI-like protein [Anaeromyces robustus]|uniref:RNI-like protein n=1 Tax=Anaeromyces robustus TaxID=1754192 RepID=A0A1Y1XPZ3_9FUNG|nr:RNI-like protein [Anaeromyces robustus]|eukprot:ORX87801.1 RNI-like protein [Anaeromyces robustus]